jgi:hypothetical protein
MLSSVSSNAAASEKDFDTLDSHDEENVHSSSCGASTPTATARVSPRSPQSTKRDLSAEQQKSQDQEHHHDYNGVIRPRNAIHLRHQSYDDYLGTEHYRHESVFSGQWPSQSYSWSDRMYETDEDGDDDDEDSEGIHFENSQDEVESLDDVEIITSGLSGSLHFNPRSFSQ